MKKAILSLMVLTSTSGALWAAPTGAAFLNIERSPRSTALGRAGLADMSLTDSLYINPAGLAAAPSNQISAMHTRLYEQNTLSAFAFGSPFGDSQSGQSFGVAVTYLSYGDIQVRDENRLEGGEIRPMDLDVGLSYARMLGSLKAGMTVRGIQQKIGNDTANGWSTDLGVQTSLSRRLKLGLAIVNLGPAMKFISEKYSLPTTARLGLGYTVGNFNILSDVGTPTNGGKTWFALGTEFVPGDILSMQLGYLMSGESRLSSGDSKDDQLARFAGMSGGIGLRVGRYQVNYAITPHAQLGSTQQVGVKFNFK